MTKAAIPISVLRWAGSKRRLLPILMAASHAHSFRRYIEPFVGSASLFFALKPQSACLGDINNELIATYIALRDHPTRISRLARGFSATEQEYYKLRALDPKSLPKTVRAARFIYLNRFCFNGVYRTDKAGRFNVPRGARTGAIPSEESFREAANSLTAADLVSGDFEQCLRDVGKNDLVYLDPPYANNSRATYGEYGYGSFNATDHVRLIDALARIDRRNARFILSYADSLDLLSQLPRSWTVSRVRVRRHVSGFANHRGHVTEVLVSNRSLGEAIAHA